MSKSQRARKYTRMYARADKLAAQYAESVARVESRLDPEFTEEFRLAMERRTKAILTPEVVRETQRGYESLARTSAALQEQNKRLIEGLKRLQEKEWRERCSRPLPGGSLQRAKRLRKKRESVMGRTLDL